MFGERIRQLRQSAGMTQAELAKRMGISSSSVGMYEQNRRKPSGEIIWKLCKLFDISSDWLLSGSEGVMRQYSIYQTVGKDLAGMLDQLRETLIGQEGLMFNGKVLEDGDLEAIFDAMKLGAEIAASQSSGRKKGSHETGHSGGKGIG